MELIELMKNVQLLSAIQNHDSLEVKKLLDNGADVNFVNLHDKNKTPLHYAVETGSLENVQMLLDRGADTQAKNVDNKKPIDVCTFLEEHNKRKIAAALRKMSKNTKQNEAGQQTYTKSDSAVKSFTKRSGTAAVGQFYETKLLTMVLFRLLHDDQVDCFYLGTNLSEAGAFDDIVLRTSVEGKSHVHCIQAKHRDAAASVNFKDMINLKDTKGDFHLSKYFDSFLKLRYMFSPTSNHAIFQGEYEQIDVELIILTPAVINYPDDAQCENTKKSNKFYTKQTGKTVQIKCTTSLLDSLKGNSQEWHRKVIAEILAKLILFKKYDTSNLTESFEKLQIENVLSEFLKQNVSFDYSGLLQLYSNQELMKISDRNIKKITEDIVKILTENLLPTRDEHLKVVNEFFSKLKFYSEQATEEELEHIVRIDIKSENYESDELIYSKSYAAVESWWKTSGQVPFLNESCTIFDAAVNEIKLDGLHAIGLNKIKYDTIKFRRAEYVIPAWVNLNKEIKEGKEICMNIFGSIPEFSCIKLVQYLQYYKIDFKFIIIDQIENLHTVEEFAKNNCHCLIIAYTPESFINKTEDVVGKINKLIIITKEKFNYQGKSVNVETNNMLDLEVQCQEELLKTQVEFQGFSLPLNEIMGKAPRSFIDGLTLQNLIYGKKLSISNSKWLNDQDDLVDYYIDRVLFDSRKKQQKSIAEISEGIVVVASEPGMGKSTLLTRFGTMIKKSNPSSWIVRLNLLDYSRQLHEWIDLNETLDESHAMSLMMIASCEQENAESFEKRLFRWCCEHSKIILLVDGFDEISPVYTSIVLQLLKIYKESLTAKVWATTRTGGVQKELERCLEVRAYSLKPFSMDETKQFLRNFWNTKLELRPDQQYLFEEYVEQLMSHLSKSIENGELELISVPLQMKMIAMIFQDNFTEFCNATGKQAIFEKLDLVSLYHKFIKFKFMVILVEEKCKIDITKPYNKKQIEDDFTRFEINHKQAAIYALFNQTNIKFFFNDDEIAAVLDFLEVVQKSTEKTGIITRVVDDKPIFVHQTYAEFFAALFISEKYFSSKYETFECFVENILIKILVRNEKVQIAKFIVGMAQKKIKKCSTLNLRSCLLFCKLIDILPNSWNDFNSKVLSFLLGIVECSLTLNSGLFEELKKLIFDKDKIRQIMLLLKASDAGYLRLVQVVLDDSADEINSTVDWLDNWTALHFATNSGHKKVVEYLVKKSANVNCVTKEDGRSALHMAAEKGYSDIVKILLLNNADVNIAMSNIGITPLHLAAREGFIDIVADLLTKGAKIDSTTAVDGETALHIASGNGHLGIVQLLIEKGIDVNIKSKRNGSTALHIATRNKHIKVVMILLQKGAHVNVHTTDSGITPMHWAVQENLLDTTSLLLENGASIDIATKYDGYTPLHIATLHGYFEIVKFLLNKGANICLRTELDGYTPLHLAARNNFCDIATSLLDRGADINSTVTEDGGTPLHSAAERDHLDMVQLLIKKGANVNIATSDISWKPLHWAARNDNPEIIKMLAEIGGNINCITSDVRTPLYVASQYGSINAVKILLDLGADPNLGNTLKEFMPLHAAARFNHPEIIKMLAEIGCNINCTSVYGRTPLYVASVNGSINAVKILLDLGADPNLGTTNNEFMPLHGAAYNNHPEIIKMLAEIGCNINCTTSDDGRTPLYEASRNGSINAVKILLDLGADPNLGNTDDGDMPLHTAARNNHPEIIKMLAEIGCNINCTTSDDGRTPLYVASQNGSINAVKILLDLGADPNLGKTDDGDMPLHAAARCDHFEILKMLTDSDININYTTMDGRTPLYEASRHGAISSVKFLLDMNADPNLTNTVDGYSPLHTAAWNDHPVIVDLLVKKGANINCITSSDGQTPLNVACQKRALKAMKTLLNLGAD